LPSTRTSPLGLHRSHCRVRRLGYATLGAAPTGSDNPAGRPTPGRRPSGRATGRGIRSRGRLNRNHHPEAAHHHYHTWAGTRRLGPSQWSNLDTQNRTTSGNRVTAHNAHELFIPLQAATFWANFGWIVASTCGAPATHNHFLLLSKVLTKRDYILRQFSNSSGSRPTFSNEAPSSWITRVNIVPPARRKCVLQSFARSQLTRAIHMLQACGFYAPIPLFKHALSLLSSKLAADMCYHHRPTCGRHAPPPSFKLAATLRQDNLPSDRGQHAPTPSFKLTANKRQPALQHSSTPNAVRTSSAGHPSKIIFQATEANMRRHHLSSSRPTSASLPCNILLRRMPFARPVPVTPPFSPLPGDNHPTPPAPSAKPPIPRFYDLRHRLQRRARHWMLAPSISLPDSERRLTLPLTRSISDQVGSSVAARRADLATDQVHFGPGRQLGSRPNFPGHPATSLPATSDIRRTLLANHDYIPSPGGHVDYLLRKWLPRRYRRSSAHNSIKGCAAFSPSCLEPFPSRAHARASPRARAGTDACTNPRPVLDPSIGARPLPRCSTFCWLTSRPPLAWIPAHQRTTAVFRPSKNTYTASSLPIRGGALFRAESSLRLTLRRLIGRANGFTHAPALAPVPSPPPRLARHLHNLGPHLYRGPDFPGLVLSARRPIAPGRRRRAAPDFCPLAPTAGLRETRPAGPTTAGRRFPIPCPSTPPAAGTRLPRTKPLSPAKRLGSEPAASFTASRIHPNPVRAAARPRPRPQLPHPGPTPFTWTPRPIRLAHPAGRPARHDGRDATPALGPPAPDLTQGTPGFLP
jgi:hypothetical protein